MCIEDSDGTKKLCQYDMHPSKWGCPGPESEIRIGSIFGTKNVNPPSGEFVHEHDVIVSPCCKRRAERID